MPRILHFCKAWLAATFATYLLASMFHTQMVLVGLTALGIDVPPGVRAQTTLYDIYGLAHSYGAAILVAMGVAMLICIAIWRFTRRHDILAPLAGGTAIFTVLQVMQPIMYITLIAGARGVVGMTLQVLAGMAGGFVFAWLYQRNTNKSGE